MTLTTLTVPFRHPNFVLVLHTNEINRQKEKRKN